MMGKKTWEDVSPSQDPFVPDLLNNLVWWTNATRNARLADQKAADAQKAAA